MDKWKGVIEEARMVQLSLSHRFNELDPCPQCGIIDLDFRKVCIHRERDDEFGLPRCEL